MTSPVPPRLGAADLLGSLALPTRGTCLRPVVGLVAAHAELRRVSALRGGHLQLAASAAQREALPFDDPERNQEQIGYTSELVSGGLHTGTHIDALCHITCGDNDEWHGGVSARDAMGNYGAESGDASELPVIIGRGVLLDIPKALGVDVLPPHFGIGEEHLRQAAEAGGVEVRDGDIVLVRTRSDEALAGHQEDPGAERRQRRRPRRRPLAGRPRRPLRRRRHPCHSNACRPRTRPTCSRCTCTCCTSTASTSWNG
ncbi:cyclase family protein [Yinghuangia aomiensis]